MSRINQFNKRYTVDPDTSCWQWTGAIKRSNTNKEHPMLNFWESRTNIRMPARRFAFETFIGEIPDNLVVTNTCGNDRCVNPNHLDLMSQKDKGVLAGKAISVNKKPQIVCKRGHSYADYGRVEKDGYMRCRLCSNLSKRRRNAKRA